MTISVNECTYKYPDHTKVPRQLCQECRLRKLPDNSEKKCAWGNDYLKAEGFDI